MRGGNSILVGVGSPTTDSPHIRVDHILSKRDDTPLPADNLIGLVVWILHMMGGVEVICFGLVAFIK